MHGEEEVNKGGLQMVGNFYSKKPVMDDVTLLHKVVSLGNKQVH